jgi:hypothetical protein
MAGMTIALPLLLSPVVALIITALLLRTWKYFAVADRGQCRMLVH